MLCLFYHTRIHLWSSRRSCHISSERTGVQLAKHWHTCCIDVFHFKGIDGIRKVQDMKLEIPAKYFAIVGGAIAAIAIISLVLVNYHVPASSESASLQHADSKLLEIYNSI